MKIIVKQTECDSCIDALFEKLNPDYGIEQLKILIGQNRVNLFEVLADGVRVGIFVVRIEKQINGDDQLVIMHVVAAHKTSLKFTGILGPIFDEIARKKRIRSIRIHSQTRGLDKISEQNGYKFQEAIFVKRLD